MAYINIILYYIYILYLYINIYIHVYFSYVLSELSLSR